MCYFINSRTEEGSKMQKRGNCSFIYSRYDQAPRKNKQLPHAKRIYTWGIYTRH